MLSVARFGILLDPKAPGLAVCCLPPHWEQFAGPGLGWALTFLVD